MKQLKYKKRFHVTSSDIKWFGPTFCILIGSILPEIFILHSDWLKFLSRFKLSRTLADIFKTFQNFKLVQIFIYSVSPSFFVKFYCSGRESPESGTLGTVLNRNFLFPRQTTLAAFLPVNPLSTLDI